MPVFPVSITHNPDPTVTKMNKRPMVSAWQKTQLDTTFSDDLWYRADGFGWLPLGYTVIDVDNIKTALPHLKQMALPETLIVKTLRGFHIIYATEMEKKRINAFPKIDLITGYGAFLVGPGSSGYEIDKDRPISPLPPSVRSYFSPEDTPEPDTAPSWILTNPIPKGQRNDYLAKWGGFFISKSIKGDVFLDMVKDINTSRCDPPLSDKEVYNTVGKMNYKPKLEQHDLAGAIFAMNGNNTVVRPKDKPPTMVKTMDLISKLTDDQAEELLGSLVPVPEEDMEWKLGTPIPDQAESLRFEDWPWPLTGDKPVGIIGRPGSGKSILAAEWAIKSAAHGKKCILFTEGFSSSIEMLTRMSHGRTGDLSVQPISNIMGLSRDDITRMDADVIIIDTLSDYIEDLNKGNEFNHLNNKLKPLYDRGAKVVMIFHTGHSEEAQDRPMGHTQQLAKLSYIIKVHKKGKEYFAKITKWNMLDTVPEEQNLELTDDLRFYVSDRVDFSEEEQHNVWIWYLSNIDEFTLSEAISHWGDISDSNMTETAKKARGRRRIQTLIDAGLIELTQQGVGRKPSKWKVI